MNPNQFRTSSVHFSSPVRYNRAALNGACRFLGIYGVRVPLMLLTIHLSHRLPASILVRGGGVEQCSAACPWPQLSSIASAGVGSGSIGDVGYQLGFDLRHAPDDRCAKGAAR